jgi:hypothetical protein
MAAGEHGCEELDADHQAHDQTAEAEPVVNEQRNDRQRQADRKIAAEQRRDDAWRWTGQVNRRGLRLVHIVDGKC